MPFGGAAGHFARISYAQVLGGEFLPGSLRGSIVLVGPAVAVIRSSSSDSGGDLEGEWAVEGTGVAPDIEVWDLPEAIAAGRDPSIEKAVEVLLEELESYTGRPESPAPPDMSGN